MTTPEARRPLWRHAAVCAEYARLPALTLARVVLANAVGLLIWSLLPPLLVGWHGSVVISDSMRPRLKPGDVVLDDPHRTPKAGQVILFHDPADARRIMVHRVREVRPDGSMLTAGDANASRDSTPVPKQAYIGLGRLRIPWVGLPLLWWRQGRYQRVGAIGLGLAVVAGLASLRPRAVESRRASRSQGVVWNPWD
jgi:signal peptidase I